MKALFWIVAGVGAGFATYFVLNATSPQYASGSEAVENAARKTSQWGTKQRVKGRSGTMVGKLKQGLGKATGNDELEGEGVMDQGAGAAKDTVGKAVHAVSETIHDLNR